MSHISASQHQPQHQHHAGGRRGGHFSSYRQHQPPYNPRAPSIFPTPTMLPNNPTLPNQQNRGPLIQQVPQHPVVQFGYHRPPAGPMHNPQFIYHQANNPAQIAMQRPPYPLHTGTHVTPMAPAAGGMYPPLTANMAQNPQQFISSGGHGLNTKGNAIHFPLQQQAPYQQQQVQTKKASKAIKIIDPATKEEVDLKESSNGPGSSSSSAANTGLGSLQGSSVAAELKSKVLVSLHSSSATSSAQPHTDQSDGPPSFVSPVSNQHHKPNAIISTPSEALNLQRTTPAAAVGTDANPSVVTTVMEVDVNSKMVEVSSSQRPSTQNTADEEGASVLQEKPDSKEQLLTSSSAASSVSGNEESLPPTEKPLPNNNMDSESIQSLVEGKDANVDLSGPSPIQREEVLSTEGFSSAGNVTDTAIDRHSVSTDLTPSPFTNPTSDPSPQDSKTPPLKEKKDVTGDKITKSIDEEAAAPFPKKVEVTQTVVSPPSVDASPNTTGQTKPLQDKKDGTPPYLPSVPSPSETLQPSSILVVKGANDKRSPDLERAKISSNEESKRPRSADDGRMRKDPRLLDSTALKAPISSVQGEPVSGNEASPIDSDELEEGEILSDEDEDETLLNGDLRVCVDYDGRPGQYDRDFLLSYRKHATEPPKSLMQISEVYCPGGTAIYQDFSSRKGYSKSRKVIEHKPQAFEKVELHKAEKRWVRPSNQEIPEDEKETQELFRKFQGILNKLTPQKFTNLAVKAQSLEINSEERLNGCIDRIFKKALEEPNFSIAYANLCRVMSTIKVSVSKVNEEGEQVIVKETSFRRELLTKCQKEFEKDKKDDEEREAKLQAIEEASSEEVKKQKQAELEEWETASRRRSLGNIRFIGELFKLKILSESIMHECIMRLLRSSSDQESLECFCRLITTTGKELDHPQAKMRMDRYFVRIADIIDKKKISSRIRFMLQDVQDLRKSDWVPRRQEGLKTIDQIHQEAEMEAIEEQKMIKAMAVTGGKSYGRDDKKKGSKGQSDDVGGRKYEKRTNGPADVNKILSLRKKEGANPSLGPGAGLRPSGWANRKKDGQTPPPGEREKVAPSKAAPQKSSSGGSKRQGGQVSGRSSQQGPRRSSSQPNEKQSAIDLVKGISQPPTGKKPAAAIADKLDEETLRRKTGTIVEEFGQNKDYSEAEACVNELESPGMMNVFVSEAILHSLEKTYHLRDSVGELLDNLQKNGVLPKEKLISGLKEVLEMADDLEVDIPKMWDFFAEILNQLVLGRNLGLTEYHRLLDEAGVGHKSPRAIARLLQQCFGKSSKADVSELWAQSGLSWVSLGLEEEEVEDFLSQEKLLFLSSQAPLPTVEDPPYLKDLVVMFGSPDTTNDDILEWIERKKIEKDPSFIRTLSRASIDSCTSGEGDTCILGDERFRNRLTVVKKYVDMNEELQVQVLNAAQVSMEKLKHPPAMLSMIFWSLYDVEVVSERACHIWRNKETELAGRGMALQTTKRFFSWLDSAEQESDQETLP